MTILLSRVLRKNYKLLRFASLALFLGWQDVKQAYRRSALGPFWITLGMAAQIGTMGVVFSTIFKTEMVDYLPFLATSVILWSLISGVISEGCTSFISAEGLIRQIRLPLFTHVFRSIWKQTVIFAHNLIILPFAFLVVFKGVNVQVLLVVPGLIILFANLSWVSFLLAILSARYRDIPQTVSSMLTILFFVSPVMWQPSLIPAGTAHLLLGLNPVYHLLQVVRLPILGQLPTAENWLLGLASACIGWIAVALVAKQFRNQIAYWV